ncbi:MAG TPA: aminoglycoside phosphotransferase family protein [Panacibacter sp.]|nr:aminoglycoside phosphotransferase family protein [Panacibacter sp.]HNP44855.1 aminoglycoside phosphotransferase family protein [Panacibacter sp.]
MSISAVLDAFGLPGEKIQPEPFGSGLINHTWLFDHEAKKYILQRINNLVFRNPEAIDDNIRLIADYLKLHYPNYYFTVPVENPDSDSLIKFEKDGYFRLFEFVAGSHSYTVADEPEIAFEAAKQFGKFTRLLSGLDITKLKITLPDFHNLSLRYDQFNRALLNGNRERLAFAKALIEESKAYSNIADTYVEILKNPEFKMRVTHHDTKISNVLFDNDNNGLCVIDLDTVMPGYFISDVGDMMRTYLSPAGEEETDFNKVCIRDNFFDAIVKGYLSEMQDELTAIEKKHIVYAGKFIIYMQALRFLSDYLNNDIYYGAKYDLHNFNRAANQLKLLKALLEKEEELDNRVAAFTGSA